jgi:hypothetical protein
MQSIWPTVSMLNLNRVAISFVSPTTLCPQEKQTQWNAPCRSEIAKVEGFIALAGTTSFLRPEIQQLRPIVLSSIWALSPAASWSKSTELEIEPGHQKQRLRFIAVFNLLQKVLLCFLSLRHSRCGFSLSDHSNIIRNILRILNAMRVTKNMSILPLKS